MKAIAVYIGCTWWLVALPGLLLAQAPVLVPRVTDPPIAAEATVPPRLPPRTAGGAVTIAPPVTVTARPVVPEAVIAPGRTITWSEAFGRLRYGFYDDGFTDDNWFYDYYETLPAAVAVEQPVSPGQGYRTSWRYDPLVEQRLFRW